jgi:hypothetical protein
LTINKFLLNELRKYRDVYIKTGLSKGDSLHSASKLNFTKLISIEINKPHIQDAKIKLNVVLFYTARSFLIRLPKNILKYFLLRKLN